MAVLGGGRYRDINQIIKHHFGKSQKWLFLKVTVVERVTIQ